MCIYFVLELLAFILVIFDLKKRGGNNKKILLAYCILWGIVAGLRRYDVGNDTPGYVAFFEGTNIKGIGYGTVQYPGETIEYGFVLLSKLLNFISTNGTFFLLVEGLFIYYAIYLTYKNQKYGLWSFLIFMLIGNNFVVLHAMIRQVFSIAFLLIGIYYFQKNGMKYNSYKDLKKTNVICGILCCIFAATIHRTSIILFPLLLILYFMPMSKRIGYSIVTGSFLISIFFQSQIGAFFDNVLFFIGGFNNDIVSLLGDRYADTFGETSSSLIRNLSWAIPCLVTLSFTDKEKIKSFYVKCYIFSVSAFLMFNASYMITRLNIMFLILGFTASLPDAINKNIKLRTFYILVTLYYLWRAYIGFEKWTITDSSLPYYFIWE